MKISGLFWIKKGMEKDFKHRIDIEYQRGYNK